MSPSHARRGERSRGDDSDEPHPKLEDDRQPDRPICRDHEKGRGSKTIRLGSDDPQRKGARGAVRDRSSTVRDVAIDSSCSRLRWLSITSPADDA